MYVSLIDDLRTLTGYSSTEEVVVGGYHAVGDGGGGTFIWKPGTRPTEDDGLVIYHNTDTTGWFQRIVNTPYISVKWFGAKGDGNSANDDAPAIQKALDMVNATTSNTGTFYNSWQFVDGSFDGTLTTVHFPAGVYLIGSPLLINGGHYHQLIGEKAIISPNSSFSMTNWAMEFTNARLTSIKSLTFGSFEKGLLLNNQNIDSGVVKVEEVHFLDISQTALSIYNCNSSFINITNCKWSNCMHAIELDGCDRCSVNGGWITMRQFEEDEDATIIVHTGVLQLRDMILVPVPHEQSKCAWINLIGSDTQSPELSDGVQLEATGMRFGGEIGAGNIVLVNNYIKGKRSGIVADNLSNGITIKDSACYSGPTSIRMYALPNHIVMEDNHGFTSDSPIVLFDDTYRTLDSEIAAMEYLFSMKLDNNPYNAYRSNSLWTNIFSGTDIEQLKMLPFVRVDSGLTSFGYAESDDGAASPLVFYMGTSSGSAILNYKSYEISLMSLDLNGKYNKYRVEVTGSVISAVINLTNNPASNAPIIVKSGNSLSIKLANDTVYNIYYQIQDITTPHARYF